MTENRVEAVITFRDGTQELLDCVDVLRIGSKFGFSHYSPEDVALITLRPARPSNRKQPLPLVTKQFPVADDPGGEGPAA